jgi:general L-amino acid transport system permease protein
VVGWLFSGGAPFALDYPILRGPNVREGTQLSAGFVSVFLGLTLYTSAFVADIVRAGIQAVPYGQIEAARSQGLTSGQVLNLVVLPQALRLIIPPLGNQYVNTGKNSTLALVVGYFDTYQIALLANNESGQAVPVFAGLMVIYLTQSLVLSVMTNLVNQTTRMRSR